jgi:hypothetical protein
MQQHAHFAQRDSHGLADLLMALPLDATEPEHFGLLVR